MWVEGLKTAVKQTYVNILHRTNQINKAYDTEERSLLLRIM